MAKHLHVSFLFFALASSFFLSCSGRNHPTDLSDIPLYTFVCNPKRFASHGLNMADFGYCNKSLSFEERTADLVGRMTLAEKIAQLGDRAQGVPRIGLPNYNWWSEALHGVSDVGDATFYDGVVPATTTFGTPILTAAAFNQSLWKTMGQVVSTEGRAMNNLGRAGLTYWSPVINLVRDPRWGRTLETPGEDPLVIGTYAAMYVRGLQEVEGFEDVSINPNHRPLKVSATCKHYTAYDLENWLGTDRNNFDAKVTEQDMIESFQPPFEMCVRDGEASALMCAFNKVNGIPSCADVRLLNNTVRGKWGLSGYIVSDCDSIQVIAETQHWNHDFPVDAVAQVLHAGLDLNCGSYYGNNLQGAVSHGKVTEKDIEDALKHLYPVMFRLGYFDGNPHFKELGRESICSAEHIELALDAARQGIVLLKNDAETLPLDPSQLKTLAVIGPHGKASDVMLGNYAGTPCRMTIPLDAFSKEVGNVIYEPGCTNLHCGDDSLIFPAMMAAKKADATVLMVGLDRSVEDESRDRTDLLLPGYQNQLIDQVAAISKGPVILVILSAGGVDITNAKDHPKIKSILWAGYPGEDGGQAIADVVFGKYNPGGRLPLTWYKADYVKQIPMTSMNFRPVKSLNYPGRTYKFFNGPVVFPFGYGLSYTQFKYEVNSITKIPIQYKLPKQMQHCHSVAYTDGANPQPCPAAVTNILPCKEHITFDVTVKNVGCRDGSDVVMVYSIAPAGIDGTPSRQLVAFKRVGVGAGKNKTVHFDLNVCESLNIVDSRGNKVLASGTHKIVIGDGPTSFPVEVIVSEV